MIGAGGIVESASPLILVRADGPLEQRAGYQGECGGWSDGHDALAERLCGAFADGDVLLVADGPGGAAAGIQQSVERVLAAKAANGRRCTGYVDEMAASAHAWWMLAVCDEVFVPPAGMLGSIGARGGHLSTAGAMVKEGLVMTYFADPPAKVALAPEFPLSEEGARRGMRDVSIAADAFRAAVCAGPLGVRHGLTPEALITLGADMLTGQAAVDAGLADGVESLETVTAYALMLAESESAKDIETAATATGARRAKETGMSLRAEGDEPDKDDEKDPEETRGSDIPTACAACGVENNKVAKFCMGCGESMATKAPEDPAPDAKAAPAARITAPAKLSATASLASILGASADTPLALKTAAIALRQIKDTAVGITGQTEPGAIVGSLLTMPERLAAADLAAANDRKAAVEARETSRRSLAARLNKLNLAGWRSGDIYAGPVVDGRRALSLPLATMDLDVLRGMVEGHEKSAPPRDPFDADRANAEADAQARAVAEGVGNGSVHLDANGEPSEAQILAAMKLDAVKQIAATHGRDPRKVAVQYLKTRTQFENGSVMA